MGKEKYLVNTTQNRKLKLGQLLQSFLLFKNKNQSGKFYTNFSSGEKLI